MKKLLTIISIAFLTISYGQEVANGKVKKANKEFEKFSFSNAKSKYEKLEISKLDEKRNLAISYWRLNELTKAQETFSEIVLTAGHTADDIYNYAAVLRENGNHEEANIWMNKFAEMNVSDSRGKEFLSNPSYYLDLRKDKNQFNIKHLAFNTDAQDFGVSYFGDKVLFVSSQSRLKSIYRRWNWNGLPFLDIYIASYSDETFSEIKSFGKKVNKKFHEGPVAFNDSCNFMIFTRNNYNKKSDDGAMRLELFSSKLVDGKWTKPEALPFNSIYHSCGHASISSDGKWLYFASDMDGGMGGVDLYKASINEDGTYGKPINLGEKINTEGNEMFPYIHPKGDMLFYSSNGKMGLGGLDIFVAQIKENQEFGKILNPGSPLNSNQDDFAFVLNKNGDMGHFSSNREGGSGDDDVYGFNLLSPFMFGKIIQGKAFDKNGEILAETTVQLMDAKGNLIKSVVTDENGAYDFQVEGDLDFKLLGTKENYFDGESKVSTSTDEDFITVDLVLEKDPGLSLFALITDKKTGEPIDSVIITLTDNMTGEKEQFTTSASGDYLKPLNDKKLNDRGSYNLSLSRDGYLSKTVTYNTQFDHEGQYDVHAELDLSMEKIDLGTDLASIIDLKPIYFDLGRYSIRPDAAIELDKIVKIMNENPRMEIELGSHTDARGSSKSNLKLSEKRAKSSADYIKERISNPDRITGKGYGESKLINECSDGVKCTEEQHQKNRRTEFIIVKQ